MADKPTKKPEIKPQPVKSERPKIDVIRKAETGSHVRRKITNHSAGPSGAPHKDK